MGNWLKQSTAVEIKIGPFVDQADGFTAETALTIAQADVRLAKNGGDWAQKAETTAAAHEENGWYRCLLDTTDTNTLGILVVNVSEAGALPVWKEFMVVAANVYDSIVGGGDTLDVQVTGIGTDVITAASIAADAGAEIGTSVWATTARLLTAGTNIQLPSNGLANITAWTVNITGSLSGAVGSVTGAVGSIATGGIAAASFAANAITAAAIATGAFSAAKFAAGAFDAVWTVAARLLTAGTNIVLAKGTGVTGFNDLSAAQVNAEADTALSDYDAPTSAELVTEINSVQSDIAALPTSAENADAVWDELLSGHAVVGSTGAALSAAGAAGDPWSTLLPGAYTAGQAGKIIGDNVNATISSRATQTSVDDVPTNAELATSQAAADDATLAAIAALNNPTVAAIADAVWDEAMAGHVASGSAGEFQANTPTSAQIVAGLLAAEITELISVPGMSPQLEEAIAFLYMAVRNRRDTTATADEIHNSGGSVIATAAVSDDGTTFTKGKYA